MATEVADRLTEKHPHVKTDVSAYIKQQWYDRSKELQEVNNKVSEFHIMSSKFERYKKGRANNSIPMSFNRNLTIVIEHLHLSMKAVLQDNKSLLEAIVNLQRPSRKIINFD